MTNKKVLVTGGAGYIGSHVVCLLGEAGYDVKIIDNLSTGRKKSILYGELFEGDISDEKFLDSVFSKHQFNAVIHFAGSIVVPESVSNPIKYYQNNTENSLRLIERCNRFKVPNFIFSSTAATYGSPDITAVTEETPTCPINPYGHSKLMTEQMIQDYHKANPDFNFIILRYFNVSGADLQGRIGQSFPGATHLIKVSCEAALGKRPSVSIFGTDFSTIDGTGVRDYIHVVDLASAHIDGLRYLEKNRKSHILNCGYGKGSSVREVINVVKKVSGVDFKVIEEGRRAGDPAALISIATKIQNVLGWKPKHNNLETIVRTAYDWEKKLMYS